MEFNCDHCEYSCKANAPLANHIKRNHPEFYVPKPKKETLYHHVYANGKTTWKCDKCDYTESKVGYLQAHHDISYTGCGLAGKQIPRCKSSSVVTINKK